MNDAAQRRAPIRMRHDHGGDISEQRQRQPFENGGVARIAEKNLRNDRDDRDADHPDLHLAADEKRCRIAHRRDIRAEIDHIGDQQRQHEHIEHPAGIVAPADSLAMPWPVVEPMRATDFLDGDHQRIAEDKRPAHARSRYCAPTWL